MAQDGGGVALVVRVWLGQVVPTWVIDLSVLGAGRGRAVIAQVERIEKAALVSWRLLSALCTFCALCALFVVLRSALVPIFLWRIAAIPLVSGLGSETRSNVAKTGPTRLRPLCYTRWAPAKLSRRVRLCLLASWCGRRPTR